VLAELVLAELVEPELELPAVLMSPSLLEEAEPAE
jgi:hypothetical protein